jgi:hypothetical protein
MSEPGNTENQRQPGDRQPSRHALVPVVIGRFDLPRLPVPEKTGGVTSINLPPRPRDMIDIIVSIE